MCIMNPILRLENKFNESREFFSHVGDRKILPGANVTN